MRGDVDRPFSISFSTFLLLVAGLMTAVVLGMITTRPSTALSSGVSSKIHSRTLAKNQILHYPIFHDQQLDAIVGDYVTNEIKRFEEQVFPRHDESLRLTFQVAHYSDQVASIVFSREQRARGLPDMSETRTLILDRRQKRQLTSHDIIVQTLAARLELISLIHDYIKTQPEFIMSSADYVRLLELPLTAIEIVGLESTHVIMRIPLAEGAVDISINKRLLGGILMPAYLTDSTDIVPVAQRRVAHIIAERPAHPSVNAHDKMLALTFDDGPGDMTPALLDALQTYDSHATFFVLGHLADTYKTTLRRMVGDGHEIGNHSWNHPDLRFQSPSGHEHQIMGTQHAIQAATEGYVPRIMRPPYGATDQGLASYLNEHQLSQVLWTVDTQDWRDRSEEQIYQRIMSSAADGRIILLHDIYPSSVNAAIRAVRDLKRQGYQLVTISELDQYR